MALRMETALTIIDNTLQRHLGDEGVFTSDRDLLIRKAVLAVVIELTNAGCLQKPDTARPIPR